ncbi:MAG: hypothetical protein M3071_03140 [Actinomycetota bacterium]|nr:hypothetical protein [Actinomycetota bacterium]
MTNLSGTLRTCGVVAAIAVALSLNAAPGSLAASAWSTGPNIADPFPAPFAAGGHAAIESLSCPTTALCVALDSAGNVFTAANLGAVGGGAWIATGGVDPPTVSEQYSTHLSCAPQGVCAFVDTAGNVAASSNPTGGTAAWNIAAGLAAYDQLPAISCPSSQLCVAPVDGDRVLTTTNPTRGASAWSSTPVPTIATTQLTPNVYTAIDCPNIGFCVLGTNEGQISSSSSPTAGAWNVVRSPTTSPHLNLRAISCPNSHFCAAIDVDHGDVITSTSPDRPGTWHATKIDQGLTGAELANISCPSARLCIATDTAGRVLSSIDPTAGTRAWTTTVIDRGNEIDGLSCPSLQLCVAVDGYGNVMFSTNPGLPSQRATKPTVSHAALTRVGSHARLTLTISAGRPPAGDIAQISLNAPAGVHLASYKSAIVARGATGKRIAFTARASRAGLVIVLEHPTAQVRLSLIAPAISLGKSLLAAIKHGKVIPFRITATDTARTTTPITSRAPL